MHLVAFVISSSDRDWFKFGEVLAELGKRDIDAEIVAFDEDAPEDGWGKYDLIIPTPALSYTNQYQRLLKWISHLESIGAGLTNPVPVIRWNIHKSYLLELKDKGITIPQTCDIKLGSTLDEVVNQIDSLGCMEVVVKPMVGASGKDTIRLMVDSKAELEKVVRLSTEKEMLVQEFIPEIMTRGEFSLIFFNGVYSHCVRKFNLTGDFRIQGGYGGKFEQMTLDDEEGCIIKSFAEKVLNVAPFQNLLYARVDLTLARPRAGDDTLLTPSGSTPVLMELELFEPALFTEISKAAVERYADAITSRIKATSPVE